MAIDKKALKELSKINELAQELVNIEEEISAKKGELSTIQRNIIAAKNSLSSLDDEYAKNKKKYDDDINERERILREVKDKQANVTADTQAQIGRLENLKATIQSSKSALENKEMGLVDREKNISRQQTEILDKKNILNEIKNLAEKL